MLILSIGGDARYAHLCAEAADRSIECAAVGMENCPVNAPRASLEDILRADALLLPNPWRSGMSLPFASHPFSLEDVLSRARAGTRILLSDASLMPRVPAHLEWVDLSRDEAYILKNARLTAEGALCAAMRASDRAIEDASCIVIGFGRIASRLSGLLIHMGAQVSVAARREEARMAARALGASAFPTEALPDLLPRAHFIFSTVPARILDENALSRIPSDALLMDLASPPFAFDLSLAQSMGLHAVRESGLPGRHCPYSAGCALLDAALRALHF